MEAEIFPPAVVAAVGLATLAEADDAITDVINVEGAEAADVAADVAAEVAIAAMVEPVGV